ncbi:hypothetical protein Q0N36_03870 [Corynebacterium kefirresidentii]|uniref:Terminase n=1 Tax=Corynebacterium kefirresidentii TaxID=1979527 RepID=A0ABT8Q3B0_9CORY|nr:hypothetical protein [Corynebacterium kefirresidentii]MDN8619723.1 hypothetical protein [Corynebacterium kefirresidentii]MDN8640892.1 hypothetical protein [Corynebacterium kefirresidentii]
MPFKPREPGEFPSLGWECLAWIEENLAQPDCAEYQPLVLTPEQARFILHYYRLDPETGQRVYTRGILSRPKGWGKSPIMGAIGALEALGPVCFGGWDASGQPVGVPWSEFTTPKVQFAAVNEDQSKNAYGPLLEMLRDGPAMRNYDIDPMETFVALPKGRIEFITAGALSKEGSRPVWFSADQTEAWTQSNGGVKLAAVLRRNTGKLGGHSIETPNAYRPGSGSVAEETFKALELQQQGRLKRETILVDHREAPEDTDLADHDSLYRGLVHAYGDSARDNGGWVDIERIITEIWDPSTDPSDARQFYLNQIVSSSDSFLSHLEVDAIEDRDKAIRPGDKIVLGFDGSRGRVRGNADATALIGMRVTDGHLFEVAVWQSKNPRDPDWEPDTRQVDAVVRDCFSRYRVVGMYCDPSGWTEHVSAWEAEFAPKLKVKATSSHPLMAWPRGKSAAVYQSLSEFRQAVVNRDITYDGGPYLRAHLLNAKRRETRTGYLLYKSSPESADKIDAAYAAVMAYKCYLDAVSRGVSKPKKKRGSFVL